MIMCSKAFVSVRVAKGAKESHGPIAAGYLQCAAQ